MPVYFIQAIPDGLIKIGTARSNVARRLRELQYNSPIRLRVIKVVDRSFSFESELHRKFAYLNAYGEWFSPTKELLDFIKSLPDELPSSELPLECSFVPGGKRKCRRDAIKDSIYCEIHPEKKPAFGKVVKTFSLPPDLWRQVKYKADRKSYVLSKVINKLLIKYVSGEIDV